MGSVLKGKRESAVGVSRSMIWCAARRVEFIRSSSLSPGDFRVPGLVEWFRSFDGRILLQDLARKKEQFLEVVNSHSRQLGLAFAQLFVVH